MNEIKLRGYQKDGANELFVKLKTNKNVLFQLATGGGKTFIFSFFIKYWLSANEGNVTILVHRKELLDQTISSLGKLGIEAEGITKDNKKPKFEVRVFVSMVQTLSRRLKKNENYVPNTKLLIVDECHRNDFNSVFPYFEDAQRVGFSATPISANKKKPLKDFYNDIVCCADIPELIDEGNLSGCKTYKIVIGIDTAKLDKNNYGEFTNKSMTDQFANPEMVKKVVESYKRKCLGEKTLIFNVNIEHSKEVCNEFVMAGYDARYLDSKFSNEERISVLKWFKETDDAILCNIDILTTGFDEPSVQCVIINRSTTSLPLWLQMTGRGGRLFPGKDFFRVIDLGGNIITHGAWEEKRKWSKMFNFPETVGENNGPAPIKDCPECGYINHTSARECGECGYKFKEDVKHEDINFEIVKVSDSSGVNDDVENHLLNTLYMNREHGYKPHKLVHEIQIELIKENTKNFRVQKFLKNKDQIIKDLHKGFMSKYKILYDYDRSTFKDFNNSSYWKNQMLLKLNKRFGIDA